DSGAGLEGHRRRAAGGHGRLQREEGCSTGRNTGCAGFVLLPQRRSTRLSTYIAERLVHAIPVLIGIRVLSFLLLHLVPGDPVQIFAGDKPLTPERAAELRHVYGLDRPLVLQYLDYATHAVRG